jgi:membrane protein YqaA with SNARE-associated domain
MIRKGSFSKNVEKIWVDYKNIIVFMFIILVVSIIIVLLQPLIFKVINKSPALAADYYYALSQIGKLSMLWLFIVTFLGSLFFISVPSDFIFLYYIFNGANPVNTIVATFFGVMLGRSVDFGFGAMFRKYTLKSIITKKYDFKKRVRKVESSLVFFGNFIPIFPIELFIVFIGTTKYTYWKFLLYNGLGKILKLIIMALFINYLLYNEAQVLSFHFFDFIKGIIEFMLSIVHI